MSSVKLQGNASGAGSVTLASPNTSNNITLTLPTTVGSSNQVMTTDGSGNLSFAATGVRNGGTTTSSAVDITLTASSNQFQQVTMTATGKYVILPDATTMTKGAEVFVIENKGAYAFGIKDSTGNVVLETVYFFQEVTVTLRDNSTAAGAWGIGTSTAVFGAVGPLNLSSISATYISEGCAALSSTSVLIVYQSAATPTFSAVIATVSGTSVSYGTPVTIVSSASYSSPVYGVVALSSTSAAVFLSLTTGNLQGFALSISGTTITVGAATASGITGASYMAFLQNSSTGGVTAYRSGLTVTARAWSVSGTTFTWGTAVTLFTAGGTTIDGAALAPIAANTYVVAIRNDNPQIQHRAFSVSGTTITNGAATTTEASLNGAIVSGRGYNISSGTSVFGYATSASLKLVYSGTTYSSSSAASNFTSGTTLGFTATTTSALSGVGSVGWGASTNLFNGYYTDLSTGTAAISYLLPISPLTDYTVLDTTNAFVLTYSSSVWAARIVKFVG